MVGLNADINCSCLSVEAFGVNVDILCCGLVGTSGFNICINIYSVVLCCVAYFAGPNPSLISYNTENLSVCGDFRRIYIIPAYWNF